MTLLIAMSGLLGVAWDSSGTFEGGSTALTQVRSQSSGVCKKSRNDWEKRETNITSELVKFPYDIFRK